MRFIVCFFTLLIGVLFSAIPLVANPYATIEGIVTDINGDPVANATVNYVNIDGKVLTRRTDALGEFTFSHVPPIEAEIIVWPIGFQSQRITVKPQDHSFLIVHFTLYSNSQLPGSLSGSIVDANTGSVISVATVQVFQGGALLGTITTSDGNYSFTPLFPGSYTVTVTSIGYASGSKGAVVSSNANTNVDFALQLNPGSVSGTVGDVDGNRLPGITVDIQLNGVSIKTAITDGSGNYTVTGLAPGNYVVYAKSPDTSVSMAAVTVIPDQNAVVNFFLNYLPGQLQGNVKNNSVTDLPGVIISVILNNISIATTQTDSSGNYFFQGLPSGSYVVNAQLNGYKAGILGATIEPSQTTTANFTLDPNPGDIVGTVSNSSGNSIEGALITAYFNNVPIATVLTDIKGKYVISQLPPGSYSVTVSANGYQNGRSGGLVNSDQTTPIDFNLAQSPGDLMGNVADENRNSLSGIVIEATMNNLVAATAITNNSGNYMISGLAPGSYAVLANASGYRKGLVGVTVLSNQAATADFILFANPAIIAGNVSALGGLPIAGSEVNLFLNNIKVASVLTDNEGNYTIAGLTPGSYTVSASISEYKSGFAGAFVAANQVSIVNFLLNSNPGIIEGFVSEKNGPPLSGATLDIILNGVHITTTLTDNYGHYVIFGLAPGSYEVIARDTGYGSETSVGIVASNKTTSIDFVLKPDFGAIEGQVTEINGTPLSGATIEVRLDNILIGTALTDSLGYYQLTGLSPGSYSVYAYTSGYQIGIKADKVKSNQTTIVNFSLIINGSTVTGRITDAITHLPISGAIVNIVQKWGVVGTVITDNDGNYILTILTPGSYALSASAEGYFPSKTLFSVGLGEIAIVNLALTATQDQESSIAGKIFDGDTKKPIARATVQLFQADVLIGEVQTDDGGHYLFIPLPPGNYTLKALATGYLTNKTNFKLSSNQDAIINMPLFRNSSPKNFKIRFIKNKFATQTDRIDHLTWEASSSNSVKSYRIYLNGKHIATVSAKSRLEYNNHNQPKDKKRVYTITSVNKLGQESSATKIKVE